MAQVFRKSYSKPIPKGATPVQVEIRKRGQKVTVPGMRFKGDDGRMTTAPLTAKGDKIRLQSPTWYGWVNGEAVPLCGNKAASETMLADLRKKAEQARAGIVDPFEEHKGKTLLDHLADYKSILTARGGTPKHINETVRNITAILTAIKAIHPADLDEVKVSAWVVARRAGETAPTLPEGETEFTPKKAAELLSIARSALSSHIRRHRLPATGKGKARRYPRATVEALLARQHQGLAPKSLNHFIRGLKGFTRWMSGRGRRLSFDPLEGLQLLNEREEVRHARRELTVGELRRLLDATRASKHTFRGIDGEARHALYLSAIGTGFRASALASLSPGYFSLDVDPPTVTLTVRKDKSRKGREQPISREVANLLLPWLKGKPADQPLWPGNWFVEAAEMIREDLAAVGIPYAVNTPNGPEHADFHCLRHSYITALGRKADLRTVQVLAGHSTPVLTARYMHRRQPDLVEALEQVGGFQAGNIPPAPANPLQSACSSLAVAPDREQCQMMADDGTGPETNLPSCDPNPLPEKGVEAESGQLIPEDASSPSRTRTYNKPVNSRLKIEHISLSPNSLGQDPPPLAVPLQSSLSDFMSDKDLAKLAELKELVDNLAKLPVEVRDALVALARVMADKPGTPEQSS